MSERNKSKIGQYEFLAEPFHVDFNGRLTMSVLGNHLLNCAGFHASDRGFGIAELNEHHCTWVLSRLAVDIFGQRSQTAKPRPRQKRRDRASKNDQAKF